MEQYEKDFGKPVDEQELLTAADLMRLQVEDDPLMLNDASLCTVCSVTCASTSGSN
jgi:hypothetical protein